MTLCEITRRPKKALARRRDIDNEPVVQVRRLDTRMGSGLFCLNKNYNLKYIYIGKHITHSINECIGGFMKFSSIIKLFLLLTLAIFGGKAWEYLRVFFGVTGGIFDFFIVGAVMALVNQIYYIVVKVFFSKKYSESLKKLYSSRNALTKSEFDELKRKTVVELYLVNERKVFIKAKIYTLLVLIATTIIHIQYSIGILAITICVVMFSILEMKEKIIAYRIANGFFGSNKYEALQLLKFINEHIDEINGGTNGGRKILNDKAKLDADLSGVRDGVWGNSHG